MPYNSKEKRNAAIRAWYHRNPDKALKRRSDPERRKKLNEYRRKSKLKHIYDIRIRQKMGLNKSVCEICGEGRTVDVAHIVALSNGGNSEMWNLMWLCPTHHRLFDEGKLNDQEYGKISDKVIFAQNNIIVPVEDKQLMIVGT